MARILIVEDNARTARALQRITSEETEHEVSVESSAEAALETIDGETVYDLIITDIFLPGMGGDELIQRVRELKPEVVVIALTGGKAGLPVALPISMARAMGADRTLQKPVSRAALSKAIKELLEA